jgi:hypothetical protein
VLCAEVAEGAEQELTCPAGTKVREVLFASYGVPQGGCGSLQKGECHSPGSEEKINELCLWKSSCVVAAQNAVFDDPCPGMPKRLAVELSCEP